MTKQDQLLLNVLGEKYNSDFFTNQAEALGKELKEKGILIFDNFLSDSSIKALQEEASRLKPKAFQSSASYNLYVMPEDPSFPKDSPRNRLFKTTKKCIPDDLVPDCSYLKTIYRSKTFRDFMCNVVGANELYPYGDNLSSINYNYYDEGDALEWHFDNSDFTITLLVKKCDKGGDYEYFTNMRYDKNGNEDYEMARQCIEGEIKPQRQSVSEGSLMIFKGSQSLHRVTDVEEGERVLVTFNYNQKPGVPLSEKSRMTFFGRLD